MVILENNINRIWHMKRIISLKRAERIKTKCWTIQIMEDHEFPTRAGQKMECMMRAQAFFHATPVRTQARRRWNFWEWLEVAGSTNKTHYMSEQINGRRTTGVSYKGNHSSAYQYHSQDLHEGRFSHALDLSRDNGRCNHGNMLCQRHKYSRIPIKLRQ